MRFGADVVTSKNRREQWITIGGEKCREAIHTGLLCSYSFCWVCGLGCSLTEDTSQNCLWTWNSEKWVNITGMHQVVLQFTWSPSGQSLADRWLEKWWVSCSGSLRGRVPTAYPRLRQAPAGTRHVPTVFWAWTTSKIALPSASPVSNSRSLLSSVSIHETMAASVVSFCSCFSGEFCGF